MNSSLATLPLPTIPDEVLEFAEGKGVADYLNAVVDLARQAFPTSTLRVSLGRDAEVETHEYIALDVEVAGLTSDALFAGQQAWSAGVSGVCPSRLAVHFVLGWR